MGGRLLGKRALRALRELIRGIRWQTTPINEKERLIRGAVPLQRPQGYFAVSPAASDVKGSFRL